jgi:hypothetical protein
MKTMNIIILCLSMLICIVSCEHNEQHIRIKFANKSGNSIYIVYDTYYPDTLSPRLGVVPTKIYKAEPNETNSDALWCPKGWEKAFGRISSDTLMVFVFDAVKTDDPNDHTPMRDRILRRYDLSIDDLQRMDWVLYYPPTEDMRDIKMWPPYGQ